MLPNLLASTNSLLLEVTANPLGSPCASFNPILVARVKTNNFKKWSKKSSPTPVSL